MRFFFVGNSISHNPRSQSQYKNVLSSIRSIINQYCENETEKERNPSAENYLSIFNQLQYKPVPAIHIFQNPFQSTLSLISLLFLIL